MVEDARHTIRNASWIVAQRGAHVVGAAVFAVLVPRLMGPALFGRYTLLNSVSMWFALLSGVGAVSMMTRVVPGMMAAHNRDGLRTLTSSLIALRSLTGIGSAAGFLLVAAVLLGERDAAAVAWIAAGVFCRTTGNVPFALFLGLNQAARWGMGELLRRWLGLTFVAAGFALGGLRGACQGFFLAELGVQIAGLWWAREFLSWRAIDLRRGYLVPFLRTSTVYATSGIVLVLTTRSGEAIVRLATGRYEEVAFFGAAFAIYLTVAHAVGQLTTALAPFLVARMAQSQQREVTDWLGRALTVMTVVAVGSAAAMVFLGDTLVPWLLGPSYRAVARNAVPLMFTLFPASLASLGRVVALLIDRPRYSAESAFVELAAFWGLGFLGASRVGSIGACWALLPASMAHAAWILWRTRPVLAFPIAPAARAAALGLVFVPLAALRADAPLNVALLAAGALAYGALLVVTRAVTWAEISALRRHL